MNPWGQQWWSRDRRVILAAAPLLLLTKLSLRLRGYAATTRMLARASDRSSLDPCPNVLVAKRLGLLVARAAERLRPVEVNCLPRALVAQFLARRRGIRTTVELGVRQGPGRLLFHAWLELDGVVVNDVPDIRSIYSTFSGPWDGGDTPVATSVWVE